MGNAMVDLGCRVDERLEILLYGKCCKHIFDASAHSDTLAVPTVM